MLMRLFFAVITTSFFLKAAVFAQNQNTASVNPVLNINLNPTDLENNALIYLQNILPKNHTLKALHHKKSKIGHHILYKHFYQNIEVFGSTIKINTNIDGQIINTVNNLKLFTNNIGYALKLTMGQQPCYWVNNSVATEAYYILYKDESNVNIIDVYAGNGQKQYSETLDLFIKKDSLVNTLLFNPDPLTTAQKPYGFTTEYKNNNGMDNASLNNEREPVNVSLYFNNDTFFAQNKYAIIAEIESPVVEPFKITNTSFNFNRSQSAFKDLMCLYHIESLNNYINQLGFDSIMLEPILVDAHAFNGSDQSRFEFSGAKPAIYFGTGGVPDAEDADVIIHEYTHAIGYAIAPNTTTGSQRLAVEEANCDFMATQHSKFLSNFNWRKVFNWDGQNEFWNGRNTDNSKKYPDNISSDFYSSSEIWSGMLNDISNDIGRDVITQLLLNSIYFYNNNITMQQAADFLLIADSILFNFANHEALRNRFLQRGFDVTIGINKQNELANNLQVFNTMGFAEGKQPAEITCIKNNVDVYVFDINGKILLEKKGVNKITLNPDYFNSGIFVVNVLNNTGMVNYKLIKW